MSIFDFEDYKEFYNKWVENQPKQGHGEYRRLAGALSVSSTLVSQVFKGDKHLSLEMAVDMAEYLNLSEEETDYFILLVDFAKAGSFKLRTRFAKQVQRRRAHYHKLENRVDKKVELTDEVKAIFYSSWIYSGVRLLTDISEFQDVQAIAEKLNLPRNQVQKVLDFLLSHGLVKHESGRYGMGPARVYLGSSNHLVARHHQNWRLQGFNKMIQSGDENFFYTAPMVLSKEAIVKIRQELPSFVERIVKIVQASPSEEARCLNIDWFEY